MNAVVPIGAKTPAKALAGRLADLRGLYLAHFTVAAEISRAAWATIDKADSDWIDRSLTWSLAKGAPEEVARARSIANALLQQIPSSEALMGMAAPLRNAAEAPPSVNHTRLLIALMADAFPNARPHNADVYLETAIAHVLAAAHPPAVIAAACDTIVATKTFLPSTAELLEACSQKARTLRLAILTVGYAEERRLVILNAIAEGDKIRAERDCWFASKPQTLPAHGGA